MWGSNFLLLSSVGLHGGVGKQNMLGFTARIVSHSLYPLRCGHSGFLEARSGFRGNCSIGSCRLGVFMEG